MACVCCNSAVTLTSHLDGGRLRFGKTRRTDSVQDDPSPCVTPSDPLRPRADYVGEDHDYDDMDVTGSTGTSSSSSSTREQQRQQQNQDLLVPRGLDLLPSMRAPRRVPPTAMANGGSSSCGDDGDNRDGAKGSGGKKTAVARAVEYVPWIGGSASLGGVRPGEKGVGTAAPASAAPAANGIEDRVRWFPRGLPMEPTAAGEKGQDERDSAMFNTRASMAIDRLGEQVGETAKRQAEMETRRREKVRYERRQTRDAGLVWCGVVWCGVVGVAESTLPPWQNASPRIPSDVGVLFCFNQFGFGQTHPTLLAERIPSTGCSVSCSSGVKGFEFAEEAR